MPNNVNILHLLFQDTKRLAYLVIAFLLLKVSYKSYDKDAIEAALLALLALSLLPRILYQDSKKQHIVKAPGYLVCAIIAFNMSLSHDTYIIKLFILAGGIMLLLISAIFTMHYYKIPTQLIETYSKKIKQNEDKLPLIRKRKTIHNRTMYSSQTYDGSLDIYNYTKTETHFLRKIDSRKMIRLPHSEQAYIYKKEKKIIPFLLSPPNTIYENNDIKIITFNINGIGNDLKELDEIKYNNDHFEDTNFHGYQFSSEKELQEITSEIRLFIHKSVLIKNENGSEKAKATYCINISAKGSEYDLHKSVDLENISNTIDFLDLSEEAFFNTTLTVRLYNWYNLYLLKKRYKEYNARAKAILKKYPPDQDIKRPFMWDNDIRLAKVMKGTLERKRNTHNEIENWLENHDIKKLTAQSLLDMYKAKELIHPTELLQIIFIKNKKIYPEIQKMKEQFIIELQEEVTNIAERTVL